MALILIMCLPWASSKNPTPPLLTPGASLSASAFRAALDARADAIAAVRDAVIDVRREQIALRDVVSDIEREAGITSAAATAMAPLDEPADRWSEAGIVAGQVASAANLNDVFAKFAGDLGNIREFQGLLLREHDALLARISALEVLAGIDDAVDGPPLAPDEDPVVVPHVFEAGTVMRTSEMNANLSAVDEAAAAEAAMTAAIQARMTLLVQRAEAVAEVIEPQPTFTWRMGNVKGGTSLATEAHYIFRNPGPFEPIPIRWSGPDGFERLVTVTSPATSTGSIVFDTLPSGTYLAEATVGGIEFALEIEFDAQRILDPPTAELVTVSSQQVEVRVDLVEGAEHYDVSLRPEAGGSWVWARREALDDDTAAFVFTGLQLEPETSYFVHVRALSVPAPWDPLLVPQQVNRSFWSVLFSLPEASE